MKRRSLQYYVKNYPITIRTKSQLTKSKKEENQKKTKRYEYFIKVLGETTGNENENWFKLEKMYLL